MNVFAIKSNLNEPRRRPNPRPGEVLRRPRAGYILVVVLGLTAVATSLALGFLDANSTVMPEAMNYNGAIRAQYMAGAGIAMASHYLLYYPTSVALGAYWTGASNVTLVGGANEFFNVSVLRSDAWAQPQTDPFLFRISAAGYVNDPDGSSRAKKSITADAIAVPRGTWVIPQAVLGRASIAFRTAENIYGDAHVNGNLSGTGYCVGNLSATGACLWTGAGPPASTTPAAAAFSPVPSAAPATTLGTMFVTPTYMIQGKNYTAFKYMSGSQIDDNDAIALNADTMAGNPGRIIAVSSAYSSFKLRKNADLNGTLTVDGRLEIDDNNSSTITAVNGFPALIVNGDIMILNDGRTFTVNGAVICSGSININNKNNATLNLNGPVIISGSTSSVRADTIINYRYTASRQTFWDLEGTAPRRPITILNWKEK